MPAGAVDDLQQQTMAPFAAGLGGVGGLPGMPDLGGLLGGGSPGAARRGRGSPVSRSRPPAEARR